MSGSEWSEGLIGRIPKLMVRHVEREDVPGCVSSVSGRSSRAGERCRSPPSPQGGIVRRARLARPPQRIHGLRQSLRAAVGDTPVVIHQDQSYFIEPNLDIWVDIEVFEEQLKAAHQHFASAELVQAEAAFEGATWLYQGEFLADEPYEEWAMVTRENLRLCYLDALDRLGALRLNSGDYAGCVAVCLKLLSCDSCREDAHCRLMRCYSRQGQVQLAIRQYRSCVAALRTELDVAPAPATTELFDRLRRREVI